MGVHARRLCCDNKVTRVWPRRAIGNLPRAFHADICHRTFDTLRNVIGTERKREREKEREREKGSMYGYISGNANEKLMKLMIRLWSCGDCFFLIS